VKKPDQRDGVLLGSSCGINIEIAAGSVLLANHGGHGCTMDGLVSGHTAMLGLVLAHKK
jgi:hypothetical protein